MAHLLPIVISILVITEFVFGNFVNVFITLVIFFDWVKKRTLSLADWILSALAVSRIFLLSVILIYWDSTIVNPTSYGEFERRAVLTAWAISNHFSIWLATSLSILYLLKIASFSNFIFLHLRRNIDRVILFVLAGSFVFFFCYLYVTKLEWTVKMNENEGNATWKTNFRGIIYLSKISLLTMTNLLSFTISLICFLLLIYSLCKHIRKMQNYGRRHQDPSTEIHVKAMQIVVSFLLVFTIYFVSVITTIWDLKRRQSVPMLSLGQAIELMYPLSHSCVLIWGNRKLKETCLWFVLQVRCWLMKPLASNISGDGVSSNRK